MTTYRLRMTIQIDHPELRGPSFAPVAPGSYSPWTLTFRALDPAIQEWERILAGGEDYGSEYVRVLELVRDNPSCWWRPTTVRRSIHRDRKAA